MYFTQSQLLEYLTNHNISYTLYAHEPLFTCKQAIKVVEQMHIPGVMIKNLFLKDSKGNFFLIIAAYDTFIDLKKTGKALQAKELRFADATLLMRYLGITPGSVTPLALINDKELVVQVIIDTRIFEHDHLQVHPLQNDATVVIACTDLVHFFKLHGRIHRMHDFVTAS